ncbi:MAG: glycosyltransferase family 4 protein [Bacteroidota bacterium]|nr:glycosyltransferase family 4 protein [Bacteroidota bacterium]
MKKVLFVTYYWPPSGGSGVQRPLKFVKYLRHYGWEPVVYTVSNGEFPEIDESLLEEVPEGIEIIKKPIFEPFNLYKWFIGKKKDYKLVAGYLHQKKANSLSEKIALWIRSNVFVPDARIFWIRPSVHYLTQYIKKNKIDALITTGPPHSVLLIGLGVKKRTNIPWLVDFRDPWTQIDYWDDLDLTTWARNLHKKLERKVLQQANTVVCVGKTWGKGLEDIGGRKVAYISNGYDEADIHKEIEVPLDSKFSIVHIGMMGKSRNHEVFWQVLSELVAENKLFSDKVVIKLYGKLDESAPECIEKYKLTPWVEIYAYVPHKEIIYVQKAAQVLYLSVNNTANALGILTGKIYEYLAVQRPLLCIGPEQGEAAQVIYETKAGLVSGFDDKVKLKQNILVLFEHYMNKQPYVSTGSNIEKYSRKYQTGQLASLLNQMV